MLITVISLCDERKAVCSPGVGFSRGSSSLLILFAKIFKAPSRSINRENNKICFFPYVMIYFVVSTGL